jgi:predicted nucleic acid-binding protein
MNQSSVVVDASVGVKWVLTVAEESSAQAVMLLQSSLEAHRTIVAPPHFPAEVANVLYQRVRRRDPRFRITREEARTGLTQFLAYPIQIVAPDGLYEQAFTFALSRDLPSVYDSLYVVLARMLGAELWTDDNRLRRNLGDAAPWVRWIGDYEG